MRLGVTLVIAQTMLIAASSFAGIRNISDAPAPAVLGRETNAFRATSPVQDQEPLAIVVNKNNSIENLSFAELRNIFLTQRSQWPNGRRITVVMRDSTPERATALQLIYKMSEADFNRYFLQASFTGQTLTPPKQLSSATGVRRFVFNVPGAVGYLRVSEVDESVKVVRVDGKAPADPGYKFRILSR